MGRKTDYCKIYQKNESTVYEENVELKKQLKDLKLELSIAKDKIHQLELLLEKDKIKDSLDCTCSSKPSSKCDFKIGITNTRKPSTKKPGGQKGHKPHTLNKTNIEILKQKKNAKLIIKKINYNNQNKNLVPIKRYILDIEIVPIIKEVLIYPNKDGKYNIPVSLNSQVIYGKNIKTLMTHLRLNENVSTDHLSELSKDLLGIKIAKGTIINWEKELENKLKPNTYGILKHLMMEPYNHVDESQINVDGHTYNIHNVSSNLFTMQWVHKNKSHKAIEEIGFLTKYQGTLIKDGTHLYDKYGKNFVSCGSHINRYLLGTTKGSIKHIGAYRMILFLNGLKQHRKKLKKRGLTKCTQEEYQNIRIQYETILDDWYQEIIKDKNINPLYEEERKLQNRLMEDEKQHLMFMKDFSLPFTNNRAETDIRPVKGKQKVGIFRNETSAERYVTIRSNISSYKKNKVNIYEAIYKAFSNSPILL